MGMPQIVGLMMMENPSASMDDGKGVTPSLCNLHTQSVHALQDVGVSTPAASRDAGTVAFAPTSMAFVSAQWNLRIIYITHISYIYIFFLIFIYIYIFIEI